MAGPDGRERSLHYYGREGKDGGRIYQESAHFSRAMID